MFTGLNLYVLGAIYSFIGANALFSVIFILKNYTFDFKMFILVSPLILLNQYIFNYIYSSVYPTIIHGWIITTVIVTLTVFAYSIIFFKESVSLLNMIGLIVVFIGLYMVNVK